MPRTTSYDRQEVRAKIMTAARKRDRSRGISHVIFEERSKNGSKIRERSSSRRVSKCTVCIVALS